MAGMTESRENLLGSTHNLGGQPSSWQNEDSEETFLTPIEKRFLLFAERGDVASVRRIIEEQRGNPKEFNLNCVDPLNRSALVTGIENENIELVRVLLDEGIKVKDSLLHAIKEEYVEGVEVLLEWEERIHVPGQPYSWEAVNRAQSAFTTDITPLILAAHMNNYEILKILLDRGATLPTPHDVRCGCDDCIMSSSSDSLRHSQARINAYKALSSSSLIALSSRDPLLTAFELSWELRRLSFCETEFRQEYREMRTNTSDFATALLDHARTSHELEIMLNFNIDDDDLWEPGDRQTLTRLKLAIKYKQKKFVAHPNVQQLLASIWYDGLPGFRRKSMPRQLLEVGRLACLFPVYSSIYLMSPNSKQGVFMKKPFVKFIFHSSSYTFFLMLLGLASQRAEFVAIEWFGPDWMQEILSEWKRKERGAFPGLVECGLVIYIMSWIVHEVRELWDGGLLGYIGDLWNIVDFIANCFYLMWIFLRGSAIYIVQRDLWRGLDPYYPREQWHQFDPMLLSEGAFAAGMIFSFLKLVHIFSVNPHLGPLQISLGRMIIDIIKFFFIYTLVLFAFGCGMNQLLWYYADLEKMKCYTLPDPDVPDFDANDKACAIWRRFANLFETSQSLFWASFGLVDLVSFDLQGIKSFTRFWALLLFGSYSVINIIVLLNMLIAMMSNSYQIIQTSQSLFWASFGMVDLVSFDLQGIKAFTRFWALLLFGSYSVINIIVLLNMLIAMMSNSYQIISERSDVEWKFARSKLWISYFDEGNTLPAPFNLLPTVKNFLNLCGCRKKEKFSSGSVKKRSKVSAQERHDAVMRLLVRRFVMSEQTKRDDYGITEDDVMEIRQDISSLRYELVDILRNNGMKTPNIATDASSAFSKKGKVMERRLIKDFQIGMVENLVREAIIDDKGPKDVFSKIANVIGRRSTKNKDKDWNAIVRQGTKRVDHIGRATEMQERRSRQSIRRYIIDANAKLNEMDPNRLVEYNPKLSEVTPATRVAYAKFKLPQIKHEFYSVDTGVRKDSFKTPGDASFQSSPTGSIARPRPRSSITSLTSAVATGSIKSTAEPDVKPPAPASAPAPPPPPIVAERPPTPEPKDEGKQAEALLELSAAELYRQQVEEELPRGPLLQPPRDFRSRTPIPEDPRENATPTPDIGAADDNKENQEQSKEETEAMEKSAEKAEEPKKEEKPKVEEVKSPRKPIGPTKPGGKSTVTGEILTGWL